MAESNTTNPHLQLIKDDMRARSTWTEVDEKCLKKRLSERKARRTKPYPGAPNFVVPIIDDTVRDKTDMELTMMSNSRRLAHIIPLEQNVDSVARAQAELGFDTYLRHIINAMTKIEVGLDMKNARGFAVFKIIRTDDPRWGLVPDFEPRDCRNVIVPPATQNILKAERITDDSYYYTETEFRQLAKSRPMMDPDLVSKIIAEYKTSDARAQSDNPDSLHVTEKLVGVDLGGKSNREIPIWEHYTYADEFIVAQDKTGTIELGDKVRILFCPKVPELLLEVEGWREEDRVESLGQEESMIETVTAMAEGREPVLTRTMRGQPKAWPFIQARYENRSLYYYDTRGLAKLLLDDQLQATSEKNAKMVLLDYFQVPQYTGSGSRVSTNISHEPGSFLPENVQPVQLQQVPPQFDFDIESAKRTAARRSGTLGQYEFSANLSTTKRVQKTATEVSEESSRGNMVSSASVDRFNAPWAELFMQLWDDLRRLKKPLPLIDDRMSYQGQTGLEIYNWNVIIVPAASSKTLNPDQQFQRNSAAWTFATSQLAPFGVTLDPQAAAMDILSPWDPYKASRWVVPPNAQGPQGQQPVYKMLADMQQQMLAIAQAVKAIGQSHLGTMPEGGQMGNGQNGQNGKPPLRLM